jgi:hypothetical protein
MSEQAERREVLKNNNATTYHAMANLDTSLGGRFGKADIVTGDEASPQYPRLPASSPWAGDPVPPEEPLGLDVNAMEPVGTPTEIERSLASLVGVEAPMSAAASPVDVVETAPTKAPMRRRKL